MKNLTVLISVLSVLVIASCSSEHGEEPAGFAFEAPEAPTALSVTPGSNQATLEWEFPADQLSGVLEFRIYYYYEAYGVEEHVGTSDVTSFTDTHLIGNMIYCYKVSAVSLDGMEGHRTQTVCVTVNP